MRLTAAQAKEITPLVRLAVQRQIECWGFESQIEHDLGVYFKDMEQGIADLAAAGEPETIDDHEVQALIEGLEIES